MQTWKSRDTQINRQVWICVTKLSRANANRVLPREHTGHSKHPLATTQEMFYKGTSPDGQDQSQIDYILCSLRWRSLTQSGKTRPGADYGSYHELLIANVSK